MGRLAALLAICVYAGKEVRLHVMRALKEGKKSSVSTNTIPVACVLFFLVAKSARRLTGLMHCVLQEAWVKMWLVHLSNAYFTMLDHA